MIWLGLLLGADEPPARTGAGLRELAIGAGFSTVGGAIGASAFAPGADAAADQPGAGHTVVGGGSSTEIRGFILVVDAPAGSVVVARVGEWETTLAETEGGYAGEVGAYPVGPPLRINIDGVDVFTSDIVLEEAHPPQMRVRYR